jgi:hypothetical protein
MGPLVTLLEHEYSDTTAISQASGRQSLLGFTYNFII